MSLRDSPWSGGQNQEDWSFCHCPFHSATTPRISKPSPDSKYCKIPWDILFLCTWLHSCQHGRQACTVYGSCWKNCIECIYQLVVTVCVIDWVCRMFRVQDCWSMPFIHFLSVQRKLIFTTWSFTDNFNTVKRWNQNIYVFHSLSAWLQVEWLSLISPCMWGVRLHKEGISDDK